jgi:hypothetical protein
MTSRMISKTTLIFKLFSPYKVISLFMLGLLYLTSALAEQRPLDISLYQDGITDTINNIQNLINGKKEAEIRNYFDYYIIDGSKFLKKSTEVDSVDRSKTIGVTTTSLNKDEFIKSVIDRVSSFPNYSYKINIVNITATPGSHSFIVETKIEEHGIHTQKYQNNLQSVTMLANSLCNFTLNVNAASFYIAGMNCSEITTRYANPN